MSRNPSKSVVFFLGCCNRASPHRSVSRFSGDAARQASADGRAKDPHIIAAGDLSRVLGGEAAAQHCRDKVHPLRVVRHAAGRDMTQVIGSEARLTLRRDLRTLVYSAMTESLQ